LNFMEEAERVRLLSGLLLQSPPGEINDVLNDIRNIVTNDDALQEGIQPIIQQYNTEQFITVELPEKDYQVIVSEIARVPGESTEQRFIDPRSKTSYKFDHLRLEASDIEPFELNDDAEPLRSALEAAALDYIKDHFYDGVTTILSSPPGAEGEDSSKFFIQFVGNKYNPNNYWSGRWRSSYTLDTKAGEIVSKVFVDVHYYEQGNVQLALSSSPTITLPPALVASLPETSSAKKIMALIEAEETAFQSRLKEKIDEMSDKTFKSLRRLLPLTRQKVDWEKIMAYKLGAELNASKTAFGTAGVVDDRQEKQDE